MKHNTKDLEVNYRSFLYDKYTSYMTSASSIELNLLAALVDNRYKENNQKYSFYTIEEAIPLIEKQMKDES